MSVYCEAVLNYAGAVDHEPTMVSIHDGRKASPDPDQANFRLMSHVSKVTNWRDFDEVCAVHVPEVASLMCEVTGCRAAVVYEPLIRSPETAVEHSDYAPIESVHSDYTQDYRRMVTDPSHTYAGFLAPLLAANGLSYADVIGAQRIAVVQLWRNIGHQQPDRPLAICDASTVSVEELIPINIPMYGGLNLDFQACVFAKPNPVESHRWYTFPHMTDEEVLLFTTYDSALADDGRPFFTPHTAFVDPIAGAQAPLRESVEMRSLCLF